MKKTRILVLLLSFVMVFSLAACGGGDKPAEVQDEIVFRMATDHPIDHMATRSAKAIAEEVEANTNGRIKIDVYPASQLGDYNTVYEEIVRGTIDLGHITIPDSLDARLGSAYTPYLTTGYEEAKRMYAPDAFLATQFKEMNAKLDVRFIGFYLEGYIGMGTKQEPTDVLIPGADKNIKTRVWAAPASRAPMEDLGYTAVTVPYAEVATAIQTGVVDGWIGGTPNVNYHWVGEVINNFYETFMHAESTSYVMSQKSLDKLSPEDQAIVLTAFERQSAASFDLAKAEDEKWIEELEASGVNVVRFTDEQILEFANYVRAESWPKLEKLYTKELLDGIKAQY